MKNEHIALVLKYYRKLNQMSVPEVSALLGQNQNYVAEKTIYGWESGQTQPDADTLLKLCKIYHIPDILKTFGYENEGQELRLTDFELKMILRFRERPEMQDAIKKLLDLK